MTNKESIQAAHLEAIDTIDEYGIGLSKAATSCTTITAEAIGEAMEWVCDNLWIKVNGHKDSWFKHGKWKTSAELVTDYLNQKAKI